MALLRSTILISCLVAIISGCQIRNQGLDNSDQQVVPSIHQDTIGLKPTVDLMPIESYWDIIAQSRLATNNEVAQVHWLENYLVTLHPMEIVKFHQRTTKLCAEIYTSEMWCAAYLLGGGCSDDCFYYFRLWLISEGKEVYENAKANPDNLANKMGPYSGMIGKENEPFGYVAVNAFTRRTGLEIRDYCLVRNTYKEIEFKWNESDPTTMKAICPTIYGKLFREK